MTIQTIEMAQNFLNGRLPVNDFVAGYIKLWSVLPVSHLTSEGPEADKASSDIFMLADCFNPASDREEYELDACGLHDKIKEVVARLYVQGK